jgi:GNAT superfamily N-acetyltransferase
LVLTIGVAGQQFALMSIRRLDTAEHDVARLIRLRALWDSPAAYGSTYEREVRFPPRIWVDRLAVKTNATFLLESPEYGASGIVAVVRDDTDQRLAHLVGMWVDPRIRGTGAADDLVDRVIRWATDNDVPTLHLHVTDGNGPAERLHLRHGFARTGSTFNRERDGATEVEMERTTKQADRTARTHSYGRAMSRHSLNVKAGLWRRVRVR